MTDRYHITTFCPFVSLRQVIVIRLWFIAHNQSRLRFVIMVVPSFYRNRPMDMFIELKIMEARRGNMMMVINRFMALWEIRLQVNWTSALIKFFSSLNFIHSLIFRQWWRSRWFVTIRRGSVKGRRKKRWHGKNAQWSWGKYRATRFKQVNIDFLMLSII